MFVMQYIQVSKITGGLSLLDNTGSSLIDEVGKLNEVTGTLSGDLNEVRSYLLMPTKDYSLIGSTDSSEDSDTDPTEIALFRYFGDLSATERVSQQLDLSRGFFGKLLQNEEIVSRMGKYNFLLSPIQEEEEVYSISLIDLNEGAEENEDSKPTLLYLYIEKETGNMYIKTPYEIVEFKANTDEKFFEFYTEYFDDNLEKVQETLIKINEANAYIVASFSNEVVSELLRKKRLSLTEEPVTDGFLLRYSLNNEAGDSIAEVVLDKSKMDVSLVDLRDRNDIELQVTDLVSAVPPFIERLDTLPSAQQKIVDAQILLQQLFDDKGFKLLLSEGNLTVATEPRKDSYRVYHDITRGDGSVIGSIVIEKSTGVIQIVDPNGANAQNILLYTGDSKKKI